MRKIIDFFRNIKFCYQRIKWGWSEPDAWNVDMWFSRTVPQMLRYLRKTSHGCPCNMTMKQWQKTLYTMEFLLREADEDLCSMQNEYSVIKQPNQYHKRMLEIARYREDCKDEAFDMIKKYFYDLWD